MSETTSAKLTALSIGEPMPDPIRSRLEELANLPYVESVLALPDVHWKEAMEVPSSIAITTRDVIVPEFTSMDVNDGMGVVQTGLRLADVTPDRLTAFFRQINSNAATHYFDMNRYSLTPAELKRVLIQGAAPLLSRYSFDDSVLDAFEDRACVPALDRARWDLAEVVPLQLLMTSFGRSEMGLNFGGNHFLEVQVVDDILDEERAAEWGFERGQVVVMYHLGPGPFSPTLLNHYSRRTKLQNSRVPLFFFSKLLFHYFQRMGRGDFAKKWPLHFRQNGWTALPVDSAEGRLVRQAMVMAINVGYAYRLATVRAIVDGLHAAISPGLAWRLFCDISHNGLVERIDADGTSWVARHNACELRPGRPTLVAGSYDVDSYLGHGEEDVPDALRSYDHGAGHLIENYRAADRLAPQTASVTRLRMQRGRPEGASKQHDLPLRSPEPIDRLMACFQSHRMMSAVIKLRPLGNFKHH